VSFPTLPLILSGTIKLGDGGNIGFRASARVSKNISSKACF
jgi:hypothetical protein